MSEKITDKGLLKDIMWDELDEYKIIESFSCGNSRWHIQTRTVFKRISDGKLFMMDWGKAATEYQEHNMPEEAFECETYEKTAIDYRKVG